MARRKFSMGWQIGQLLAVGFCLLLRTSTAAEAVPEQPAASASILRVAGEEMERLASYVNTDRGPAQLMLRNLTRFYALYTVPSNRDELARFLRSLERIALRAADNLYTEAHDEAHRVGAPAIAQNQVEAVVNRKLPHERTQYSEVVFFPEAPTGERILIEAIDLQAFLDTGFAWQTLAQLAHSEALRSDTALPLEPDAVRRLGEGLAAYALLVLRVGSRYARQEFASELHSRHLRQAAKSVTELSGGPARTAPETDPLADSHFRDVSEESGVRFRHITSEWLSYRRRYGHTAPTFSGGGVSVGDLDGDEWPDLVFCGGQGCAAFRNGRDGRFEDITADTGLNVPGEARMAVVADLDNDGNQDVFITYARDTNRLFRGLGRGRFQDITIGSGLEDEGNISGPAIAVDYDNDGLLDLYVGNFGDYMRRRRPWESGVLRTALPNRLYRNLGGFRFEDVTEKAGVGNTGWTQALSHLDFDLDGDPDLYVANDFGPNDLLVNQGDGTFSSVGRATGSDDPFHGMNAAFSDLNRDRYPDIYVTNIWTWNPVQRAVVETNTLLLSKASSDNGVSYEPLRDPDFLRPDTGWSWAALFFDYDNDADDDLYVVNGFTDYFVFTQYRPNPRNPDQIFPVTNGRETNLLFRNDTGLPSVRVMESGLEVANENSRAVAMVDYDRDGDLDVAVSTFHSHGRLFRNEGAPVGNHWLRVELVGDPEQGTSRDVIGAQVIAQNSDGLYIWRMRTGGEGYLGMSEPVLHFGLGQAKSVDLEVLWPGRKRQELHGVDANQWIRIHQGIEGYQVLNR